VSHPLDDPRTKLWWAEQRIDPFIGELHRFEKQHREGIVIGKTFVPESSEYVFKIDEAPEIPPHFGLVTGDVLHNLRSALDHLAWQLVAHGAEPHPRNLRQIQFPIYDSVEAYRDNLDKRLPGVGVVQRTFIESRQPYARESGWLGLLGNFSNEDKH
jgi:hypothetical protein